MAERNGTWIKVGAVSAIGGMILVIIAIFTFAGGLVDERIDNKLIEHDVKIAPTQQKIQQDIAVMKVQQQQIKEDIDEIKELLRDSQ